MWRKLLSKFNQGSDADRLLVLEREKQALLLAQDEADRKLAAAQLTLERQQEQNENRIKDSVEAYKAKLLSDLSGILVQFYTQIHLSEVEAKPVRSEDVLAVAKSLLRIAQNHGLTFIGQIGEVCEYDPDWHDPVSADTDIPSGGKVIVRIPGVRDQHRVLRRAGVLRVGAENQK